MNRMTRAWRWVVLPFVAVLSVAGVCCGGGASADELGTLSGQFLYDGEPPAPEKLEINKDQEFCGKHAPVSERLLVDPKTRGLKNVVLWLDTKASGRTPEQPATDPKADGKQDDKKPKPPRMDNAKCRFDPHVVVMQAGQELHLGNEDPIAHAMLFYAFVNTPVSRTLAADAPEDDVVTTFDQAEPLPVKVTCPIHAWMLGWLVVQDHPFVAVTDSQGRFQIDGLPPGEWTFRVWHEAGGYVQKANRDGQAEQWEKGLVTVTVKAGENSLGDIKLAPELFAE